MRVSSLSLTIVLCFFVAFSSCSKRPTYEDVDCGWSGITEEQCKNTGCVWLENFPGPWCQKQGSPYIPSRFDLGFSYMNDEQRELFNISLIMLVCIVGALALAKRKLFVDYDLMIAGVFLVLAYITRYYIIDSPKEVVFDEFYFGDFANSYCNQIHFFDIHPPFAKLSHYFLGQLLGATCDFDFKQDGIGSHYTSPSQYLPYRWISAIFGTLVVPLAYLVARKMKISKQFSVLLATFVICDPLLLSETRLVLTDSQLFFYIVLSIFCALKLWESDKNTRGRDFWTVATAVTSGLAFCVKFTALATLSWIGFITFIAVYTKPKAPITLYRCFVASVIAAITFCIPFYFHFQRGVYSGPLDWNLDWAHQRLLIGNPNYDPKVPKPNFIAHLIYLIKRMLEQNANSLGDHPYASFWYEWIIGGGALLSYSEHKEEEDWHAHIFIYSSHLICYAILVGIAIFAISCLYILRSRVNTPLTERKALYCTTGALLFLGWLANIVPYALVARTTYSYHYLPGQFFGMLLLCHVLDNLIYFALSSAYKKKQLEKLLNRYRSLICLILSCVLLWSFWYYSCFVYGYGLDNIEYSKRKWVVSAI